MVSKLRPEDRSGHTELNILQGLNRIPGWIIARVSLVLTLFCLFLSVILYATRPVRTEIGETPDYSHLSSSDLASFLYSVEDSDLDVDVSKQGSFRIPVRILDFLMVHSTLFVIDRTPPAIMPREVFLDRRIEPEGEMFVESAEDQTALTFEILSIKQDDENGQTVVLKARDEGNNETVFQSRLILVEDDVLPVIELGQSGEEIKALLEEAFPMMESFRFDASVCGEREVEGLGQGSVLYTFLQVADRTPPEIITRPTDCLVGTEILPEDLIESVRDYSNYELTVLESPDTDTPGEKTARFLARDAYGNEKEVSVPVLVHSRWDTVTVEMPCSDSVLLRVLHENGADEDVKIGGTDVTAGLGVGEHEIPLMGKYGEFSVVINLIDTTPPAFSLASKTCYLGHLPHPEDFVTFSSDASFVRYSFETEIDPWTEGTFPVVIVGTDSEGNVSRNTTLLTLIPDRNPPVIYGVSDFTVNVGRETIYTGDVYAVDALDGPVPVQVNLSLVKTSVPGKYPAYFTAEDSSGNKKTEMVYVTVKKQKRVCLEVENILQHPDLPNGCEVVSLAIVLHYLNYRIDPMDLYLNYMPRSIFERGDPWTTYVGEATDIGLGCYAPCVVETGNSYFSSVMSSRQVLDVSYKDLDEYESMIERGYPVILWGTLWMIQDDSIYSRYMVGDKQIEWLAYSHCLVLIGYTEKTYIFCDPVAGVIEYKKENVRSSFEMNHSQACIVR
ncbi:MAG: C39 family peptidase [Clostridia bacterium]|nr:C39 family peptidase [Clostridia bacterium]